MKVQAKVFLFLQNIGNIHAVEQNISALKKAFKC